MCRATPSRLLAFAVDYRSASAATSPLGRVRRDRSCPLVSRSVCEADRASQRRDLCRGERARGTELQSAERERAEGDALQLLRPVPNRIAEPAYEVRAPLVYDDAQPRLRRQLLLDRRRRRGTSAIGEADAATQARERPLVRSAAHLHPVRARHVVPGVEETCRQLAVVRQQEQPRRLHVETTDGKHAR